MKKASSYKFTDDADIIILRATEVFCMSAEVDKNTRGAAALRYFLSLGRPYNRDTSKKLEKGIKYFGWNTAPNEKKRMVVFDRLGLSGFQLNSIHMDTFYKQLSKNSTR